jgi:hypothetical protein
LANFLVGAAIEPIRERGGQIGVRPEFAPQGGHYQLVSFVYHPSPEQDSLRDLQVANAGRRELWRRNQLVLHIGILPSATVHARNSPLKTGTGARNGCIGLFLAL